MGCDVRGVTSILYILIAVWLNTSQRSHNSVWFPGVKRFSSLKDWILDETYIHLALP